MSVSRWRHAWEIYVARDDPLFLLRGGGAMEIDERKLRGQIAFGQAIRFELAHAAKHVGEIDHLDEAHAPAG